MRHDIMLAPGWRYLAGFAALTILCGTSHEFVHHFTGVAICGGFGTKTFNSFDLRPGCAMDPMSLWATADGPLFTFALMWRGVAMMRSADRGRRALGFGLMFANFPINRLLFVLMGGNDEGWLGRALFGPGAVGYWAAVAVTWGLALPPIVTGYRAIGNRRRRLWLAGVLPLLPFVFVLLMAGLLLEDLLMMRLHVLATPVLGVPILILLVELIALAAYVHFRGDLMAPGAASGEPGR